jgi:hypothetical protein
MPDINGTEAIFIQEAIVLPATHSIESEKFLPGWRVVKNLDSDALARSIEDADWHSFYLAGEIKATVFGLNRPFPSYSTRFWTRTCEGFYVADAYCYERRKCRTAIC